MLTQSFVSRDRESGFTLVEVLVSTALVVVIMALVLGTVDQTQRIFSRSTAKVSQFQAARRAFDSMTRRLAQSTLNTYYRAFDTDSKLEAAYFKYTRESELQFLSGPTAKIFSNPALQGLSEQVEQAYPTHGIFFQAPTGYTEEINKTGNFKDLLRFRNLTNALVGTGFFVEYGDEPDAPRVLREANLVPVKKRYRLMQLDVPTERLAIYRRPLDTGDPNRLYRMDPQILDRDKKDYIGMVDKSLKPTGSWKRPLWLEDALVRIPVPGSKSGAFRFTNGRVLADNIIALIILPKLAPADRSNSTEYIADLAPDYQYDSWRILAQDPASISRSARFNQLPPIVQVTMIAIDEPSGARLADRTTSDLPEWTDDLFKVAKTDTFYREELARLEAKLSADPARLNYRIFTTDVVIRGSKWSTDTGIFLKTP